MNTPMNKLNTQIYEEASEWIVLHRSDDLDTEAKRRFDTWVRESPQHLRAYLEMSTIWEDVPTLQHDWNPSADQLIARARAEGNVVPLVDISTAPSSEKVPGTGGVGVTTSTETSEELGVPELLQASVEPPLQSIPVVTVPASQSRLMKLLAIAATLILTAGASGWLFLQRNVYSTDIGEQRTLALKDGSSVELNAQTKIRVAYTDDARTIELLQGQALFKVAKDPQRPFIVDSDGTKIRAVGTQFDVYKKTAGTQVTVVEGHVAVRGLGPETQGFSGPSRPNADASSSHASASHSILQAQLGEVLLSAGEQILIAQVAPKLVTPEPNAGTVPTIPKNPNPAPVKVTAANVEAATAWTQQRLVFDSTPLTEVAEEFNRYNRRPMKIECGQEDPASVGDPCNFNINGSFSSTDPTVLLRFLREQPGIVVTETTDEIRISREDTHG